MRSLRLIIGIGLTIAAPLMSGCVRGVPSNRPPIDIIPDMDDQPKYKPQGESKFFADSAAMRPPIPGTVARGELHEDVEFYQGLDSNGNPLISSPVHVTMELLKRGQERFDIFCSPCHGRLGDGKGIVVERGYSPPPTFHSGRVRQLPDGHIFDVITNGIRNMPPYGPQIPASDRWAIVAYFRALQRSQNAAVNDVPVELRDQVK